MYRHRPWMPSQIRVTKEGKTTVLELAVLQATCWGGDQSAPVPIPQWDMSVPIPQWDGHSRPQQWHSTHESSDSTDSIGTPDTKPHNLKPQSPDHYQTKKSNLINLPKRIHIISVGVGGKRRLGEGVKDF